MEHALLNVLQFKEMRTDSGDMVIQPQAGYGLGFCPDLQPDREVGVAMEGLLVGSVDVAHDFFLLKQLNVTHILNIAAGVPNAFPNVRFMLITNSINFFISISGLCLSHRGDV